MSEPSSLPRAHIAETSVPTSDEQSPSTTSAATTAATSPLMPSVALEPHLLGPSFHQPATVIPSAGALTRSPAAAPALPTLPVVPAAAQVQQGGAFAASVLAGSIGARPTSSRGGRKSKAHVASACINCKRAHLSCDDNRPCARCVGSGKQVTCFDVQHKKRGRPRIRDEGEFTVEQVISETGSPTASNAGVETSARPITSSRHRRQESFRSLRSQGSDGSTAASSPTYPYPSPTASQATFGFNHPIPPPNVPGYEVPTAYLDMDLTIVKANPPWRQIMLGGQEVVGRQLSDIAAPADGQSFHDIRNRLRFEREAREPSYMPPINQPGHDPLQGVSEADIERYTHGFDDNIFTWRQIRVTPAAQPFPARVRLAKAIAYFVTVTLPSFRPAETVAQPAPPPLLTRVLQQQLPHRLHTQTPETYGTPNRPSSTQSTPQSSFLPFPGTQTAFQAPLRTVGPQAPSRTYAPVQPQSYSSYQVLPASVPGLSIAEPPTKTTAFNTPRSAARELPQSPPSSALRGPLLPPIVGRPAPRPGAATAGLSGIPRPQSAAPLQSKGTGGESMPMKRQKLGLDDVLHR